MGDCVTMIASRPDGKGGSRKVEVDDVGRALLRFANGATGSIEDNWIATGRQGFRRIEAAPDHAPYGLFCVAPGHQIGFNDLKVIEVAGDVNAIAGAPEPFNFRKGPRTQSLVEAIQTNCSEQCWLDVA
jgi:predicted dehydrogenase